MKIVSFTHKNTVPQIGVVDGDDVVLITDSAWTGGRELQDLATPASIEAIRLHMAQEGRERIPLSAITFLPLVPNPTRIFCVGINYEEHRLETGKDRAPAPTIFMRTSQSQTSHLADIEVPAASTKLDYEGEVAILIGKAGRNIAKEDAMSYVTGYSCYNDVSVRDFQLHTTQWIPGKNFDDTGAFGPWLVTSDELPEPEKSELITRLNGEVMQRAFVSQMIFPIPEQLAYISTFTTLLPGDVIVTGTPGGVGAKRNPPVWMKPGDVIEVEVTGVGVLSNKIV